MYDPSLPPSIISVLQDYERRLRTLENSPQFPPVPLPWRNQEKDYSDVTSAAFNSGIYLVKFPAPYADAVRIELGIVSNLVGDAGEIRCEIFKNGTTLYTSAVQAHAAGANQRYRLDWKPGWSVSTQLDRWAIGVQVRLTAGAGFLRVNIDHAELVASTTSGATVSGAWSLT